MWHRVPHPVKVHSPHTGNLGVLHIASPPGTKDYWGEEIVHAKGLFRRADPDQNPVARAFEECDAPFIAGPSGSMWMVFAVMDSANMLSCDEDGGAPPPLSACPCAVWSLTDMTRKPQ